MGAFGHFSGTSLGQERSWPREFGNQKSTETKKNQKSKIRTPGSGNILAWDAGIPVVLALVLALALVLQLVLQLISAFVRGIWIWIGTGIGNDFGIASPIPGIAELRFATASVKEVMVV